MSLKKNHRNDLSHTYIFLISLKNSLISDFKISDLKQIARSFIFEQYRNLLLTTRARCIIMIDSSLPSKYIQISSGFS